MKIQRTAPLNVEAVNTVGSAGLQVLRGMDGRPLADSWEPPRVRLVTVDEHGQPLDPSDMPSTALAPVFRRAAFDALGKLPGDYEVLPLSCDDADLVVLNVTKVLTGSVDLERSQVTQIPTKIVMVQNPCFVPEAVAGVPIFKIAEVPRGRVYFDDDWSQRLSTLMNVEMLVEWDSDRPSGTVA